MVCARPNFKDAATTTESVLLFHVDPIVSGGGGGKYEGFGIQGMKLKERILQQILAKVSLYPLHRVSLWPGWMQNMLTVLIR